jgi:hypothetical protein
VTSAMKMKAACFSETSVSTSKATRYNSPPGQKCFSGLLIWTSVLVSSVNYNPRVWFPAVLNTLRAVRRTDVLSVGRNVQWACWTLNVLFAHFWWHLRNLLVFFFFFFLSFSSQINCSFCNLWSLRLTWIIFKDSVRTAQ